MIDYPNAKINLGLHVTDRRPDGYHNIETVFFPVPLCDILEILPRDPGQPGITLSGIPVPGNPEENICLRAVSMISRSTFAIHLHKQIPSGAGLGGGSSDGAFTLKMVNIMEKAGFSPERLGELAGQMGSDCPFFIRNRPAFATGRGEILSEVNVHLKGHHLAIVIPPIHVSTAEAYSMVTPSVPAASLKDIVSLPPREWKGGLVNDFEEPVSARHPEIRSIKETFYNLGAVYASMSGSGSAVYAIFEQEPLLKDAFPAGYFIWTGSVE